MVRDHADSETSGGGLKLPEWAAVRDVKDFEPLLLPPLDGRECGWHKTQPVLLRAEPGTGKSWSMLQLLLILAKTQRHVSGACFVPLLIRVQRLVRVWKPTDTKNDNLLLAYIEHEYADNPAWLALLKQAYAMRLLLPLIDGIDEAAGLKETIENFIVHTLVPMHIQVVVTSRPEGVRLELYQLEFVVMNLSKLTEDQAMTAVKSQLRSNAFFENATRLSIVRREQDRIYTEEAFPTADLRSRIEAFSVPNLTVLDGGAHNPDARQRIGTGTDDDAEETARAVSRSAVGSALRSTTLARLDTALREQGLLDSLQAALVALDVRAALMTDLEAAIQAVLTSVASADAAEAKAICASVGQLGTLAFHRAKEGHALEVSALWAAVLAECDELYVVSEELEAVYTDALAVLVDSLELGPTDICMVFAPPQDPVRIYERCLSDCDGDIARIPNVLHSRAVCASGESMITLLQRLSAGIEHETAGGRAGSLTLLRVKNKFHRKFLDPTRSRSVLCHLRLDSGGHSAMVEVQVHHRLVYEMDANTPYEFFRTVIGRSYGEDKLNAILERTILFLQEASGIPVLLSMLVLVFEEREAAARRGDKAALPASRLELYEQAMRAVVAKLFVDAPERRATALRMLQRVAVANMEAQRREFDADEVAVALGDSGELAMWQHLQAEQTLPLIKVLAEADPSGGAPASFQFKHLSFAEGLWASHMMEVSLSEGGWDAWRNDGTTTRFLNEAFHQNTCRIGGDPLGGALAMGRDELNLKQQYLLKIGRDNLQYILPGMITKLRALRLSDETPVGEQTFTTEVCENMAKSAFLQELDIPLSDDIAAMYLEALELHQNQTLRCLRLKSCPEKAAESLSKWLRGRCQLERLDATGNAGFSRHAKAIAEALERNERLSTLVLRSCSLNSNKLALYGEALKANHSITDLDLSKNAIDGTIEKLGEAMRANSTLRVLDLGKCGLGPDRGHELAHGLGAHCRLEVIRLHGNANLGDEACAAIATALEAVPQLRELNMHETGLGVGTCAALCDALRGRGRGVMLHVGGNPDIELFSAQRLVELLCSDPADAVSLMGGSSMLTVQDGITPALATLVAEEVERGMVSSLNIIAEQLHPEATKVLAASIMGSEALRTLTVRKMLLANVIDVSESPCAKRGGVRSRYTVDMEGRQRQATGGYGNDMKLSHDGRRLFWTARSDSQIGVWNMISGELLMLLEGHTRKVTSLVVSRDGSRLYSCSDDKTVRAWYLEQGACEMILEDHKDIVVSLAESVHGDKIFSGGGGVGSGIDTVVRIWDARQGIVLHRLEGHTSKVTSLAPSPDGKHLYSCSLDTTIRVWNIQSGEAVRVLHGHPTFVTQIAIRGDRLISLGYRCALHVWDLTTGTILHQVARPPPPGVAFSGNFCLLVTKDGKRAFAAQVARPDDVGPSTVAEIDVDTGTIERKLDIKAQQMCMRDDDRRLVVFPYNSNGHVVVWEI